MIFLGSHIIWHQDMGFGIQFLESVEHMEKPSQLHKDMCTAWDKYQKKRNKKAPHS